MRKRTNALTIIGLVMVCTGPAHLATQLLTPHDIWWTPKALATPLAESGDRVTVLVADETLGQRIDHGTLLVTQADGSSRPLTGEDVAFRFNNWDRVRADRNASMIWSVSYLTAGILMLLGGLFLMPRMANPAAKPPAPNTGNGTDV